MAKKVSKKQASGSTRVLRLLEEALTVEEIPALENLDELEELIRNSNIEDATKRKLVAKVKLLKKGVLKHTTLITQVLKTVKVNGR